VYEWLALKILLKQNSSNRQNAMLRVNIGPDVKMSLHESQSVSDRCVGASGSYTEILICRKEHITKELQLSQADFHFGVHVRVHVRLEQRKDRVDTAKEFLIVLSDRMEKVLQKNETESLFFFRVSVLLSFSEPLFISLSLFLSFSLLP
jgi:hypothetical protein